jgi:hypothetical protein
MESMIHDNNIYAIDILCEAQKVILHTEYRYDEPAEYTDIIFSNAAAYQFEHIRQGNIVLDIEEFNPIEFYSDYAAALKEEDKYGLPISVKSADIFSAAITRNELKIYVIYSSYGMSGWIICSKMELRTRSCKNALA